MDLITLLWGLDTFVTFVIILAILVLSHEWGHYWVAKKVGIYVEEFGFGLPPRAWGRKIGETLYSINWLPIGGFVRLYGEDAENESGYKVDGKKIPLSRAFFMQNPWARVAVVVAGVIMNFLLAVVVFSIVFGFSGLPGLGTRVQIYGTVPGSPADKAGLLAGDVVIQITESEDINDNGVLDMYSVGSTDEFVDIVSDFSGKEMKMTIVREQLYRDLDDSSKMLLNEVDEGVVGIIAQGGEPIELLMTPRDNPPENEGALGVQLGPEGVGVFYPGWQMPFRGSLQGLKEALAWIGTILGMLVLIVKTLVGGSLPEGVAGPVGIVQITGQVVRHGLIWRLNFLAMLSVNLAVMNMLPLPALDGGRLWFILYEAFTGKRVPVAIERRVHSIGMMLLLGLLAVVTVGDLGRIFNFNLLDIFK